MYCLVGKKKSVYDLFRASSFARTRIRFVFARWWAVGVVARGGCPDFGPLSKLLKRCGTARGGTRPPTPPPRCCPHVAPCGSVGMGFTSVPPSRFLCHRSFSLTYLLRLCISLARLPKYWIRFFFPRSKNATYCAGCLGRTLLGGAGAGAGGAIVSYHAPCRMIAGSLATARGGYTREMDGCGLLSTESRCALWHLVQYMTKVMTFDGRVGDPDVSSFYCWIASGYRGGLVGREKGRKK